MHEAIEFELNGQAVRVDADPTRMLLWVLRSDLALTGAKFGCGIGACGACVVLVDNKAVRSCLTPLSAVRGKQVTTIEGLAHGEELHPIQGAFIRHGALQCGYCTPGMILRSYALLLNNPDPTPDEVMQALEGHLCRCGAHPRIVEAICDAAQVMQGEAP